jgi:predicted lipid-binding transport protein (Tim44 family)
MRRDNEHKRFAKRLENERPQPSDEFMRAMKDRLESERVTRPRGLRLALAGGLSAMLVLAFALTGGIGHAASAVKNSTSAVTTFVAGSSKAQKTDTSTAQGSNTSTQSAAQSNSSSNATTSARGNQTSSARNQYQGKVVICHRTPGNPENAHTISVSPNAVPAHLAHGDTLGPCPNGR